MSKNPYAIFSGDSCQYWLDLENKKLTSPFYPKPYVSDGLGCEWLITAPEDNYIVLEFNDVSLVTLGGQGVSEPDSLDIFDGVCTDARLLHTFIGQMGDDDKWSISSSGPNMLIRFNVGIMIEMNSYTGFSSKFSYGKDLPITLLKISLILVMVTYISVNCAKVTKGDDEYCSCYPCELNEGPCFYDDECLNNLFCGYENCLSTFGHCCTNKQIKSPNYPGHYLPNTEKTWTIKAPLGSIIDLQFHSFHVILMNDLVMG